jgi:hypothetical protein
MEQYQVALRGKSSKGKEVVRLYGSQWDVVGQSGPNVLIVSPPTMPTLFRTVGKRGDVNFDALLPDDAAGQ